MNHCSITELDSWRRLLIKDAHVGIRANVSHAVTCVVQSVFMLRYVYTLRLIGTISCLGACYIRTKVTKCIREKMTMFFRGLTIKSHSSGYEIGPINRSV